jgi:hypothetical protein
MLHRKTITNRSKQRTDRQPFPPPHTHRKKPRLPRATGASCSRNTADSEERLRDAILAHPLAKVGAGCLALLILSRRQYEPACRIEGSTRGGYVGCPLMAKFAIPAAVAHTLLAQFSFVHAGRS